MSLFSQDERLPFRAHDVCQELFAGTSCGAPQWGGCCWGSWPRRELFKRPCLRRKCTFFKSPSSIFAFAICRFPWVTWRRRLERFMKIYRSTQNTLCTIWQLTTCLTTTVAFDLVYFYGKKRDFISYSDCKHFVLSWLLLPLFRTFFPIDKKLSQREKK